MWATCRNVAFSGRGIERNSDNGSFPHNIVVSGGLHAIINGHATAAGASQCVVTVAVALFVLAAPVASILGH
jgi:hypothetical protein